MKQTKVLFILQYSSVVEQFLFADLTLIKNLDLIILRKTLIGKLLVGKHNPISKLLKRIKLFNYFINQKYIYNIGKYINNKKTNYIIILQAQCLNEIGYSYFETINKRFNCKLVLYILDSVHASSPTFQSVIKKINTSDWDKIYSYDEKDAKEFGWDTLGLNYFSTKKMPIINKKIRPEYDVYFVGGIKGGKEKLIFPLYEKLLKNNIQCNFSVFCYNDNQYDEYSRKYPNISFLHNWKTYDEVLQENINTNCIIEILQENQNAQSIRYFEAIYFNKKLLTNNPNIVILPYYNPKYMKYFKTIEDIDISWIKEKIEIDYKYKNDFSPINFIEQVKKEIN